VAIQVHRSAQAQGLAAAQVYDISKVMMQTAVLHPADAMSCLDGHTRSQNACPTSPDSQKRRTPQRPAPATRFGAFAKMIKTDPQGPMAFDFNGRNRRSPRDPDNALLSFA
jgi:CRISPR/Cas system-associated endonuclease Cas1